MNRNSVFFVVAVSIFIASCTPNVARIHQDEQVPSHQEKDSVETEVDTVSYTIEFENSEEREDFLKYYNEFRKKQSSEEETIDSTENSVHIKINPSRKDSLPSDTMTFSAVEKSKFVESAIERALESVDSLERAEEKADSLASESVPDTGGIVKMYVHREFIDENFSEMVNVYPFSEREKDTGFVLAAFEQEQDTGVFIVTDSSSRRLELQLSAKLKRANGQTLTALDIIELWSRLIRNKPAEGLTLFKNVRGIEKFINGEEPLVRGFNAVDEKTVKISFSKPDTLALTRMRTSRLLNSDFMLGTYYTGKQVKNEVKLLPNRNSREQTPLLDECTVKLGGDGNAVLSFSLGKYSLMSLNSIPDLEFARTDLTDSAYIKKLNAERYFLACRSRDPHTRLFVKNTINPDDLLNSFVKGEGEVIRSVRETDEWFGEEPEVKPSLQAPVKSDQFRILFRNDDPVSKVIGERVFADLTHAGMKCELVGADETTYELALAQNDYDCAVGWVQETIQSEETEYMRYAEKWFSGEMDSKIRLQQNREIPLFSLNNYLLIRNNIQLHQNKISGMWVKKRSDDTELSSDDL